MSSKREEEKNEKIIRGLMKLPPNRTCMNCNSLGPQFVCTNFWTFVCIICSGIHREFTHRVKSVSMAKFSSQEVQALQKGGNQNARDTFLKDWDMQRMKFPNNSNADKIREFIRNVYIDKKYAGERYLVKPSRDIEVVHKNPTQLFCITSSKMLLISQKLNIHEEDGKRASLYHSSSQRTLNEQLCEDSRIVKISSSDQGLSGRTISNSICSPKHQQNSLHHDKISNESSSSLFSDYSVSSTGDPFRCDSQSSNFQDSGYSSPNLHKVRDISIESAQSQMSNRYFEENVKSDFHRRLCPEGNISSGSFGSNASSPESFISASESCRSSSASFRSASESFRSASTSELFRFISSDNELENVTEDEKYYIGAQDTLVSTIPSPSRSSTSWHAKNQECFNEPIMHPITTPILSVDLFDDICQRPSYTTQSEENPFTVSPSETEEWATFDIHEPVGIFSQTNSGAVSMVPPGNKAPEATEKAWASMHNSQWFSSHNSLTSGPLTSTSDQFHLDLQPWHNFDNSTENTSHTLYGSLPQNNQLHTPVYTAPACYDPYTRIEKSEDSFNYGLQRSTHDDMVLGHSLQPISTSRSSFAPPVLPQMIEVIHTGNSTNPFDFPYDLDSEAYNEFSDLSSLQATMSFPEVPTFLNGPPQHWLPQSSITQGELSHTKTQSPSYRIPNPPPQCSATSRSGNPFS